jgi:branched-chain amino acid transport system substrate-binding protein
MTFSPDPTKREGAAAVVKALQDAGKTTEGYVMYTYAAIQAYAQAVTTAGSTDYDAVRGALNSGDFNTVLGDLNFDAKGDVSLPGYVFYRWSDGKYAEIE